MTAAHPHPASGAHDQGRWPGLQTWRPTPATATNRDGARPDSHSDLHFEAWRRVAAAAAHLAATTDTGAQAARACSELHADIRRLAEDNAIPTLCGAGGGVVASRGGAAAPWSVEVIGSRLGSGPVQDNTRLSAHERLHLTQIGLEAQHALERACTSMPGLCPTGVVIKTKIRNQSDAWCELDTGIRPLGFIPARHADSHPVCFSFDALGRRAAEACALQALFAAAAATHCVRSGAARPWGVANFRTAGRGGSCSIHHPGLPGGPGLLPALRLFAAIDATLADNKTHWERATEGSGGANAPLTGLRIACLGSMWEPDPTHTGIDAACAAVIALLDQLGLPG